MGWVAGSLPSPGGQALEPEGLFARSGRIQTDQQLMPDRHCCALPGREYGFRHGPAGGKLTDHGEPADVVHSQTLHHLHASAHARECRPCMSKAWWQGQPQRETKIVTVCQIINFRLELAQFNLMRCQASSEQYLTWSWCPRA